VAPGLGVEAVLRCCVKHAIGRAKSRPEGLAPRSLDRLGLGRRSRSALAGVESYAETTSASRGGLGLKALERLVNRSRVVIRG